MMAVYEGAAVAGIVHRPVPARFWGGKPAIARDPSLLRQIADRSRVTGSIRSVGMHFVMTIPRRGSLAETEEGVACSSLCVCLFRKKSGAA
jgi:hypothetical protein